MSWKLLGRPKTVKVTKALAKEYTEMEPAPHDRPLSERRLQVYQRLLAEGLFRPVTWASALCKETEGIYRVNGKHTATMLAGLEKLPEFFVTVEEYECDSLEDVARLYSTFDSKMMSRTVRDINASFMATVPELAQCSLTTVGTAVSGMAYHLAGGVYDGKLQAAERAELMLEHPEFVVWLQSIYAPGDRSGSVCSRKSDHLRRYPVAAAMFGNWQKNRADATKFWEAVRDETGDKPTNPDRKLASFLIRSGVEHGKGMSRTRRADPREFYVRCIHGWNAWRKGENTDLRYYPEAALPAIR